jgi:hypothetical protein
MSRAGCLPTSCRRQPLDRRTNQLLLPHGQDQQAFQDLSRLVREILPWGFLSHCRCFALATALRGNKMPFELARCWCGKIFAIGCYVNGEFREYEYFL